LVDGCYAPAGSLVQSEIAGDVMGREEIATPWRFIRHNGITEGFHNKTRSHYRQAYGFRNFDSYRLRVKVLCG